MLDCPLSGTGLREQGELTSGTRDNGAAGVTCQVLGVAADSPLARRLRGIVGTAGTLAFDNQAAAAPRAWSRTVSGTALQWFADPPATAPGAPAHNAGIRLDLLGTTDPGAAERFWQILDANGRPLLQPFVGLALCHRAPFVASLVLVERRPDGTEFRLAEAHISTRLPYGGLLGRLAETSGFLLRMALLGPSSGAPYSRPSAAAVKTQDVAKERLRIAAAITTRRWHSRLRSEHWAVGEFRCPVRAVLDGTAPPVRWITSPDPNSYVADPFPWPGRPGVILCERYPAQSRRGEIVALRDSGANAEILDLGLDCHLSYPFTWSEGGRVFCVPESSAARQTIIYELDPDGTARPHVVVDTERAIGDPTVFYHEGRYWLAYCDSDLGMHDTLCLLYADRLEGPWTPHRRNPVKIDIRSARPGGTPFLLEGSLFRPAQDCSLTYGGALVINRVLTCTPDDYQEIPAAVLQPDPRGPYPDGLHTLSVAGDRVLIDGKRFVASPTTLAAKLVARLRR